MKKTKDEIQSEALNVIKPLRRAGVGITMGAGKTLLGLKHLNSLNVFKALVVAPKKSIFDSWVNDAKQFGYEDLLDKITFCTYLSLIKQDYDYDIIYFDECHSLLDSHRLWLNQYHGRIIGLTGTPPKFKSSEKGRMVNDYCPIVFTYITDEAIDDNILNDYKIIIHLLELDKRNNIPVVKGERKWYTSEHKDYTYWSNRYLESESIKQKQITSIQRMKSMQNFRSKEIYAKKLLEQSKDKCILFANTQEQADKLCSNSYHSNNSDSEENLNNFKLGKIDKLSCVLQLNEGVNIPNLKEGIIMHAYGNNRKSAQRIGRLLRLNPDDTAIIHILCYKDTIDSVWVKQALSDFDENKIEYYDTDTF